MSEKAKKGDWVQIYDVILPVGERAPQVPEDTKKVPLEMRLKGFLEDEEAAVGDNVTITTLTGRKVRGKMIAINPRYEHDYGNPQPELITIGVELRKILREGEE